jgi:PPOX class probable F420-dependent enzyme
MAFALPDPSTEFGGRVARRLAEEPVAWLTVVDRAGRPQPSPVWFLWDGDTALIYSRADAKRLEHVRAKPGVALHLDGNGQGGDIVVLTGDAEIVAGLPAAHENPGYLAKYGERIEGGWPSAENFASIYSVPMLVRPRRVRGY